MVSTIYFQAMAGKNSPSALGNSASSWQFAIQTCSTLAVVIFSRRRDWKCFSFTCAWSRAIHADFRISLKRRGCRSGMTGLSHEPRIWISRSLLRSGLLRRLVGSRGGLRCGENPHKLDADQDQQNDQIDSQRPEGDPITENKHIRNLVVLPLRTADLF